MVSASLLEEVRTGVVEPLRVLQSEIERAIYALVRSMSVAVGNEDTEYQAGQRAAVAAVVDYSLTCIEQGEWSRPIPSAAITQAHRAARHAVSMDAVVLRYIAGHRLLGEFVMDEADRCGLSSQGPVQRHLRRTREAVLECLTAAIANEYRQEHERVENSPEQQRRELIQGLLVGELTDASELGYFFDAWHLGIIATGSRAKEALQILEADSGRQVLSVPSSTERVWGWLGGQQRVAIADIENLLSAQRLAGVSLAIGEPAKGVEGWRETHRQAQEALQVALLQPQLLTRYADIALLTPWLQDSDKAQSLVKMYLSPLDGEKGEGDVLRQTLSAYFGAGYNVKASAAWLGVDRSTVRRRVRMIEERLGRPLQTRQAELEVALRLEGLLLGRQIAQVCPQGACRQVKAQGQASPQSGAP